MDQNKKAELCFLICRIDDMDGRCTCQEEKEPYHSICPTRAAQIEAVLEALNESQGS